MKHISTFLCLFLSVAIVANEATAERFIPLGDDELVSILELEEDKQASIDIQLGNFSVGSDIDWITSGIYIVLDPFAPLDVPCGADGHLKPESFKRITAENSSELSKTDFKKFSFFTPDKSTIGFVTFDEGSGGTSFRFHFYDFETKQSLVSEPGCDGEEYWINSVVRVIGKR